MPYAIAPQPVEFALEVGEIRVERAEAADGGMFAVDGNGPVVGRDDLGRGGGGVVDHHLVKAGSFGPGEQIIDLAGTDRGDAVVALKLGQDFVSNFRMIGVRMDINKHGVPVKGGRVRRKKGRAASPGRRWAGPGGRCRHARSRRRPAARRRLAGQRPDTQR